MGFFDSIRHTLNPEVQSVFNDLYRNYYKGLKCYCDMTGGEYNGYKFHKIYLSQSMSYDDMKQIYKDRAYIRSLHRTCLENERIAAEKKAKEEKKNQDYHELEDLQKKYPHAFIEICNKTLRGIIYNDSIKMPGMRKSNRQERDENTKSHDNFLIPYVQLIDYSLKYYNNKYRPIGMGQYGTYPIPSYWGNTNKPNTYYKEPKSVRDLFYVDVEKLLLHKDEFKETEERILRTLKNEEVIITYDDKVLDNTLRAKYVKDFLIDNGKEISDKEFVVYNLSLLDDYISNIQARKYLQIKHAYPDGLRVYESYNSKDRKKIIEDEEIVKSYNTYANKFLSYIEWEEEQKKHARKSRDCSPSGYGCYSYDIEFNRITKDGKDKKGTYKVWQHFISAYFFDNCYILNNDLLYLHENAVKNTNLLNCVSAFIDKVYDKTFDLIISLKNEFGNITVLWGDSDFIDSHSLNKYHFGYLRNKLDNAKIKHTELENIKEIELNRNIVIVELITENSCLRNNCRYLIEKFTSVKPLISYISIRKGYEQSEIEKLIDQQKQKRKEEEQNKIKEREIQEKIEREKQQKEELIKSLKNSLRSGFTPIHSSIKCFSLYNYYPTTCDFEATQEEWNIRNLIWDFKANPNRPQSSLEVINKHRNAENIIIPLMIKVLKCFYGVNLSKLTLICIPSSKQITNERRYKSFSERLCKETGMENGYNYVKVEIDGEASHLGGTKKAQYSIDEKAVKDKYVILFDDVITTGKSIEKMKTDLANSGASVIGGFSIGRTRHERQDSNPIDSIL